MTDTSRTEKAGHLAWCALVALRLAVLEGSVVSAAQQELFLTRWLATALKQRRFHRDVAPDLEWLLKQGRQYGLRANLVSKLDYLWQACTGDLSTQSDLFRLKYALETAIDMHWRYYLLSDREWGGQTAVKISKDVNAMLLLKSSLVTGFDDTGRQTTPLMVIIKGKAQGFQTLLQRCGWQSESASESGLEGLFLLTACAV